MPVIGRANHFLTEVYASDDGEEENKIELNIQIALSISSHEV
jgi:hypothetical protein